MSLDSSYTPLKAWENERFYDIFKGIERDQPTWNAVMLFIVRVKHRADVSRHVSIACSKLLRKCLSKIGSVVRVSVVLT